MRSLRERSALLNLEPREARSAEGICSAILFIGTGNTLRGDDAAGVYAVRELRRQGFATIETPQLTPELAEAVSGAALVVFLDASLEPRPGEVRCTPVREGLPTLFDHHFDPGSLLRLTHAVYGRAPKALLLEVGVASCQLGDQLTPYVSRGVSEMVSRARTLPIRFLREL